MFYMSMSIFESFDKITQNSESFWTSCNQLPRDIIFKGSLIGVKNLSENSENQFLLTKKFLIKLDAFGSPEKMTSLEWKLISPFEESNQNLTRYGFTLGHHNFPEDFYVKNEKELNLWISHLSTVGIMTDIEDHFEFKRIIGRGGNSTVFLARRVSDSKMFAIKSISKINHSQSIESIAEEIKITRTLDHPNIVHLHQVFESRKHIYMVLDYVAGGDLYSKIIHTKSFSELDVLGFCEKFLKVLKYLSSMKIVHRDIKLENILINSDNITDFKLTDFGLATIATKDLTLRCGSPGYIAPEILRKETYGENVDIFGAGIIAYTLLTGKMPFYGFSQERVLEKNKQCNINYHDETLRYVSKEFIALLQKMTSPNPKIRISIKEALKHRCFLNLLGNRNCISKLSINLKRGKSQKPRRNIKVKTLCNTEIAEGKTKILSMNFIPVIKIENMRKELNSMQC